jgi:hypothetical protein
MAAGRRLALLHQATLVWSDKLDTAAFIEWGQIGKAAKPRLSPELQAEVERQIDQIMANGRRLVVPPKPVPNPQPPAPSP